jgi:hypothetical protein
VTSVCCSCTNAMRRRKTMRMRGVGDGRHCNERTHSYTQHWVWLTKALVRVGGLCCNVNDPIDTIQRRRFQFRKCKNISTARSRSRISDCVQRGHQGVRECQMCRSRSPALREIRLFRADTTLRILLHLPLLILNICGVNSIGARALTEWTVSLRFKDTCL